MSYAAALIVNMQAIEVRFDTGHFLLISQQINSFNIRIDKFFSQSYKWGWKKSGIFKTGTTSVSKIFP